jgi:hypothetical protein
MKFHEIMGSIFLRFDLIGHFIHKKDKDFRQSLFFQSVLERNLIRNKDRNKQSDARGRTHYILNTWCRGDPDKVRAKRANK